MITCPFESRLWLKPEGLVCLIDPCFEWEVIPSGVVLYVRKVSGIALHHNKELREATGNLTSKPGHVLSITNDGYSWVPGTLPGDGVYIDGDTSGFVWAYTDARNNSRMWRDGKTVPYNSGLFRDDIYKPFGVKRHTMPQLWEV